MHLILATQALAAGLADCPRPYDTSEILDAVAAAELAFTKIDAAGFAAARAEVQARVACSRDILSHPAIARVHRVEAIAAFVGKNPGGVTQALAGVFTAEPGHQVPATLLPDGHPIREQVPGAMMAKRDDIGAPLPALGSGWVEADGTSVKSAPTQRSSVMQQLDGQGEVLATHYRWPDEQGFDWLVPVAAPEPQASIDLSTARAPSAAGPSPWGRRAPLLALSAGSLVASGVLYAPAAEGKAEFDASPVMGGDASEDDRAAYRTELEAMQAETNGLTYGFYGAAGAALALGVVTVVTW